jgi:hypothetical protein
MAGGWVGYVYAILACGSLLAVVFGSTIALYLVARARARRRPEPRVQVTVVSTRDDGRTQQPER